MQDYQIICPTVTKEEFTRFARDIVSADNQFLTLMVGLGLPFTLTYLAALGILLTKLVGLAFKPPPGLFLHPLVLLFPLTMGLVHLQFFDGLLFNPKIAGFSTCSSVLFAVGECARQRRDCGPGEI